MLYNVATGGIVAIKKQRSVSLGRLKRNKGKKEKRCTKLRENEQ
jgi:hypothetical protein